MKYVAARDGFAVSMTRFKAAALPFVTNMALFAAGCGLIYLSRRFVSEHIVHTALRISGIAAWSAALYVAAILLVLFGRTNRWSFWIVLIFAVAFRVAPMLAEPFLSTDIYRYVWDGVVQHAHINPYRYVPADPALKFLRAPNQEIYDHINRRDYARTIYPPIAQMIYFVSTLISPTVAMMKLTMLVFEGMAVGAISMLLVRIGRPRAQVLLYAWCPLVVWEIGIAGHVDAVVIAFISLAMLFRVRGNQWLTGLFLGLAVMTKFYPLVLFPALYRRGDWKMPAMLSAVVVTGYALYSSVGAMVFGFLGGYTEEEGMTTGVRFFLLQWAQVKSGLSGISTQVYIAFCGVVFLALAVWAWSRAAVESPVPATSHTRLENEPIFLTVGMAFAFALMLLFSPHYPWYVIWLVPFLAVAPNIPLLVYLIGFCYLFATPLAMPGPPMFLLNEILYGAVTVAFAVDLALRYFLRTGRKRSVAVTQLRDEPGVDGENA